LKKPTGSVRFRFYKLETEKTEPNRTQSGKKPEKKNRVKTEKTESKQFGLNRFRFFKKKKFSFVIFFYKNRTESKMITHVLYHERDSNIVQRAKV
jgi:hypothetical protein